MDELAPILIQLLETSGKNSVLKTGDNAFEVGQIAPSSTI